MARVAVAYVEVRPDLSGFGERLKAELAKYNPTVKVGTDIDGAPVRKALSKISKDVSREKIRPKIDPEITIDARKIGKNIGKALSGVSGVLGRSNVVGRALGLSFEAAGKAATAMGAVIGDVLEVAGVGAKTATKGVDALGSAMGDATKAATGMGSAGAKMTSEFAATFSVMGSLIGSAAALAGGFAIVTVVVGALQVGLAAALAIAIPLVAAITALVGELVILGATIAGSLSILPGILGAALAAFGPLVLVADKFSALMEDTATHTGELFVAVERLKNAIFAVISSGFIAAVNAFVNTTLPKFFGQLDAVAQAWNRVLLSVVKLASQADVVNNINLLLATGAKLVDAMGSAIRTMGPALLAFAGAASPAVLSIVDSFKDLIGYMASWVSTMAKSGVVRGVFSQIATIVAGVVQLFKQLLPLVWTLFNAAKGPALNFIATLNGLVSVLNQMFSSAAGQTALTTFFTSVNRIVSDLSQLFVDLIPTMLQFGDTISNALTHAKPLLETIVGIFNQLLTLIMPGLNAFMDDMNAALSDPGVQVAVKGLGDSLSILFETMANRDTVAQFIQIIDAMVTVISGAIMAVNKLNEILSDTHAVAILRLSIGDVRGAINSMASDMRSAGTSIRGNLNGLTGDFNTFGATVGSVSQGSADSLRRFANLKSWSVIQNNMVVIANGMAALGAAAAGGTKEWRNIGTQVGAMKQVLQTAEREQANEFKKLGTSAGNSFMAGYNAAVATKKTPPPKGKKGFDTKAGWLSNLTPALGKIDILSLLKAPKLYDTGREMANLLAKGITSGAKNIKKVSDYIYKNMKPTLNTLTTKLKAFGTKAGGLIGSALPAGFKQTLSKTKSIADLDKYLAYYQDKQQQILDGIDDFKARAVDALTKGANLVGYFGFIPTPQEVQAQLNDHLQRMTQFTADLAELQRQGLSKELAKEWLEAGVDQAGNLVEGLKGASRSQLEAISGTFNTINQQANAQALTAAEQYYGVGRSTVQGYIDGIKSMRDIAATEMGNLVASAIAAAKKKLGIKSPSTVFADIGVDTMAGYIQGVDGMTKSTVDAIGDVYSAVTAVPPADLTTPTVKPGYATAGTLATSMTTLPPQFNIRVFIGDRELTDIVSTQVDGYDNVRARDLLFGRRGG